LCLDLAHFVERNEVIMYEQRSLTGYARVAVEAAQLAAEGTHPTKAWATRAAEVFKGKPAAEVKGCPKSAFLGLAEAGLIRGVAPGDYSKSVDNRRYAEDAVKHLIGDGSWASRPRELWSAVAEQAGSKRHNSQMDVVLALWHAQLLQLPLHAA
jgi:hypothetical protein